MNGELDFIKYLLIGFVIGKVLYFLLVFCWYKIDDFRQTRENRKWVKQFNDRFYNSQFKPEYNYLQIFTEPHNIKETK